MEAKRVLLGIVILVSVGQVAAKCDCKRQCSEQEDEGTRCLLADGGEGVCCTSLKEYEGGSASQPAPIRCYLPKMSHEDDNADDDDDHDDDDNDGDDDGDDDDDDDDEDLDDKSPNNNSRGRNRKDGTSGERGSISRSKKNGRSMTESEKSEGTKRASSRRSGSSERTSGESGGRRNGPGRSTASSRRSGKDNGRKSGGSGIGRSNEQRNRSNSGKGRSSSKSSPPWETSVTGPCVPPVMCPRSASRAGRAFHTVCKLHDGSLGVVCSFPDPGSGPHEESPLVRADGKYPKPPEIGPTLQVVKPGRGTLSPEKPSSTSRGKCVPLVQCPPVASQPYLLLYNWCRLPDWSPGVHCSFQANQLQGMSADLYAHRRAKRAIQTTSPLARLRPMDTRITGSRDFFRVSQSATAFLDRAAQAGRQVTVAAQGAVAARGQAQAPAPEPESPTALTFLNSISTNEAQAMGVRAQQSISTISSLQTLSNGGVERVESLGSSGAFDSVESDVDSGIPPPPGTVLIVPGCIRESEIQCNNSIFRTITGECNNQLFPRLGSGRTGFKRLLNNTYDDGVFTMRTRAFRGGILPSSRKVSERVLDTMSNELRDFTLSLMQFSQFIDHDLTHALMTRGADPDNGIECCLDNGQTFPDIPLHPACIPIPIPSSDPFYSQFGQRCMSLVRSLNAPQPLCIGRPANPLNELTAFLDSSNVYGSEDDISASLRSWKDGLMLTSANHLLPPTDRGCRPSASACFLAGDSRVNEQSGLVIMHTVFVREHNRIARHLLQRHHYWNDERLFQEARRILNAEWQHITYNEWLPIIVGFDYANAHGLLPLQNGFSHWYDPFIDPSISNAFSSAAFRFGHSMVRDMYDLISADGQVFETLNLTRTFFDPTVITESLVGHARTLVARRSETFDKSMAVGLHEQLFTTNFIYGLDLLAFNIQRGRDHGTPTYAQVAKACGIVNVVYWGNLYRVMSPEAIDKLRSVYDDPRDVDLFIGGVAEERALGAQVGPTFQCLISQQFFDIRFGDRFFYDNGGLPHSFSARQLREIRKSSWARIMCDTLGPDFGNDFTHVQPLAFLTTLGVNEVVDCSALAIPTVNLDVF